jgi:putative acetyltransferase
VIQILEVDPREPEITAILQTHLDFCRASTPAEHVYALDVSKLVAPNITVFAAKLDGEFVGVGAVRIFEESHAEIKSMHTLLKARGKGISKVLVQHMLDFARQKGVTRMSLETGTNEAFKPARELYKSFGFIESEAFSDYVLSEDNMCMSRLI